jgi:hypothetical protein
MHVTPSLMNVYPLQATVATGAPPVGPPSALNVPCGLQQVRTVDKWDRGLGTWTQEMPARYVYTTKRQPFTVDLLGANAQYIELPAGSGTFYAVIDVQDMDRDGPSEQRRLAVVPQRFPNPMP